MHDFFRRLALHRFVKAFPPSRLVVPAPDDLVAAYEGRLPASILELWRCKGLGFYGDLQFALIDPRPWQAVLDRWILSPPNATQRIPIALTPLGRLVYYRKLTETDEDVACIDPVSKEMAVLAWDLEEFFNNALCDRGAVDSLIPPGIVKVARRECGPLEPGEIYEVDQLLYSMQMLRVTKADALELHRRLRDALDPPKAKADKPEKVREAIPQTHRSFFERAESGAGVAGLYLSSYLDWHRLLALEPDGQFHLLFWRIHHQTFERIETRSYTGEYRVSRNAEGDELIELDIVLREDSIGSDENDARLIATRSGGATLLLCAVELEDIATAIGGWGLMGRSEHYFRKVALDDAFLEEPSDGRKAPPHEDLPRALQALIHVEPLITRIMTVDELDLDEEEDGEGTVMCTLDLAKSDGLRMNMPLFSPENAGRSLVGWVWDLDRETCRAGVRYRRDENGKIVHGPRVGDVLTTRAPDKSPSS